MPTVAGWVAVLSNVIVFVFPTTGIFSCFYCAGAYTPLPAWFASMMQRPTAV